MSIELIKDLLKIEELRGKEEIQALVETEVYLNPSKPNIEKILWVDGLVEILTTKIIRDKLLVSGVVKFKVVYKSGEEESNIYSIDSNLDFKEEIDIEGITEQMSGFVKANIEYIQEEILDERKLSLRALINLEGKVKETNGIEIIKDVGDVKNLEILRETIRYKEIQGREVSYAITKEAFEIGEEKPNIEEILKISMKANEEEISVVDDRIIVSGIISNKIIYYGENKIATIEEEIPFNHFLEIPGALADSEGEITIEVVEGKYEVLENDRGQLKIIDLEAKLRISGHAYMENEKDLIVDLYSTEEKLTIEKEEINLIENIDNIIYKEKISKVLSDYQIKEIYDLVGHPTIIESRFIDDEIIIEGMLSVQGIYLEEETEDIVRLREDIPYRFQIPIEYKIPNASIDMDISLEPINLNFYNENPTVEAIIKHKININRNRVLSVINLLDSTGELIDKANSPSIIIYIVQRDDILWDIAKRYNTTMEEILQGNENINPNNIMPGEKIIIEKKVDVQF